MQVKQEQLHGLELVYLPIHFTLIVLKICFNVDNSTNLITAAVSQRFAIKPNTQYTLSYVGFMSVNSGGYNIFLRGRKGNVAKESQFIQGGRLSVSGVRSTSMLHLQQVILTMLSLHLMLMDLPTVMFLTSFQ